MDNNGDNMTTENTSIVDQIDTIKALLTSFENADPVFVSQYSVERCYGGPEEGGWWYDWLTFDRVVGVFPDHDDAIYFAQSMNKAASEDRVHSRRPNRFSVNGGADLDFITEQTPGEARSTERPHYE
jgi:hypothetical protein